MILLVPDCLLSSNRDCQNLLNVNRDLAGQSDVFRQFEGGVKLGIGSFNLVRRSLVCFSPRRRNLNK